MASFRPAAWLLVAAACSGSIGGDGSRENGAGELSEGGQGAGTGQAGAEQSGGAGPAAVCEPAGALVPTPLHRLTAWEFDNTVRDLLADVSRPAQGWPGAASSTGFDNSSGEQSTAAATIKAMADTAADVAARAATRLGSLVPCNPASGDDKCAAAFIESFGRRAYRRPLTAVDRERLTAIYTAGKQAGGFSLGIQTVIELALASPHFLYRIEGARAAAGESGLVPLTDHELGARLSYFLTGSMPDEPLNTLADAGQLGDPGHLEDEARRLMALPAGRAMLADFHRQWLLLDRADGASKDAQLFPRFTPRTLPALVQGAQAFVAWVVQDAPAGSMRELFLSNVSFVNEDSAWVLGASGIKGTAQTRIESPAGQRSGILTLPAWLGGVGGKAAGSAPVMRGKFVREHLLCQTIPAPPADVNTQAPAPASGTTTRERFAEHSTNDRCASCHRLLDGVGFGFEHYDGVGAYRTSEEGQPTDASGEIVGTRDVDGAFDGAAELAARLADSVEARACLARMWLRYALARLDAPLDDCLIAELSARLGEADFRVAELPVLVATSAAFRHRTPLENNETACTATGQGGIP